MPRYRKVCRALLTITSLCLTMQCVLAQDENNEVELDGNTTFLDLSGKDFKELLDLTSFQNLEEVDFSNNYVTEIDRYHFAQNTKLKKIDLSDNTMLSFPESGPFIVSSSVKELNLSNCNIEKIMDQALDGLKNLQVLDLRENAIAFEESTAFEFLETPPKRLIVSKITESELKHICKHVDMQIEIVDANTIVECKNVRRTTDQLVKSPNVEKMSRNKLPDFELVDEGLLTGQTHMELDMMADDPLSEGSGDNNEEEIVITDKPSSAEDTGNKLEVVNSEKQDEDVNHEENIAEDKPPEDEQNGNKIEEEDEDDTQVANSDVGASKKPDDDGVFGGNINGEENREKDDDISTKIQEKTAENEGSGSGDSQDNNTWPPVVQTPEPASIASQDSQHHDNHEHDHEQEFEESSQKIVVNPLQRSNVQRLPVNIPPIEESESTDPINTGENKTDTTGSVSKNVIIGLIVGAVIMGSVFVAIKLYKDRKTYEVVNRSDDPNEGKEMQTIIRPENKPLMMDTVKLNHHYDDNIKEHPNHFTGTTKGDLSDDTDGRESYQFSEVVIDQKDETTKQEKEKSTMEILADNSGLPDIDDPSRLSTIIVSNTNLNTA